MTIDNLIGKAKLTKISKPLYLPRHLAIKRAQELKKKQEELVKKGVINNNTSTKDIKEIAKTINEYSAKKDAEKLIQETKLTPGEKEAMRRMEAEAKIFKDYRVGDLRSRLPKPTGWRILVMPYRRKEKTKKGIILPDQTLEKEHVATVCAYVLEVGPDAYMDKEKFPEGSWCKKGDWIIFGRYAGARIKIDDGELRLLNDDEILATIQKPEDILHMT
jgi:co-chaperonin GroES (HSP10)